MGGVRAGVGLVLKANHACHVDDDALLVVVPDIPSIEFFPEGLGCRLRDYACLYFGWILVRLLLTVA